LEVHPDHPETHALKALFLQALGEEVKALEVAKISLIKSKMRSMFCWHTAASIYKQKKDFNEAAKAFQNALKLEPDNLQIMREAACLQVQVRDLTNHAASRFSILKQKPNMIQHWVAFTVAHHLVPLLALSVATSQPFSNPCTPLTASLKRLSSKLLSWHTTTHIV
jgi:N-alpha-acetyltransferase 15/16, NatA auxiliary subunit